MMGLLNSTPPPACDLNQHCLQWARIYLKYCLCSMKDGVSLALGVISVVSWGVAEVPQIITNYKEKSTEGLSVAFLMTWIVGDLFNLIGCVLEPATLPTQYYMALLYTATTVILTTQTVYYSHIYHRLKTKENRVPCEMYKHYPEDMKEKLLVTNINGEKSRTSNCQPNGLNPMGGHCHTSSPIPVAAPVIGNHRDSYYMSARSLSRSPVPRASSCLVHPHECSRIPPLRDNGHALGEPLHGRLVSAQSAPPLAVKNMLSVVPSVAIFLGIYGLHIFMKDTYDTSTHAVVMLVGRNLLQDKNVKSSVKSGERSSGLGSFLGWAMAAIYMGGRLPQICLNVRRGNTEGLNPLMFVFALIGNATYVGSILVNSLDWSKIRPNLPWLVDAGGCVLLDAFILIQFIYFHLLKSKGPENRDDHSHPV